LFQKYDIIKSNKDN